MCRNIVQWREIRRKVLEQGIPQREMSRRTGISRETISKMVQYELPPERVKQFYPSFKNDRFSQQIVETIEQLLEENNGRKITVKSIFDRLRSDADYPFSYNGLREYIAKHSFNLGLYAAAYGPEPVFPPDSDWRLTHAVLASCSQASGVAYLKSIASPPVRNLNIEKMQQYAAALRKHFGGARSQSSTQTTQDAAAQWINTVVMGTASVEEIATSLNDDADVGKLVEIAIVPSLRVDSLNRANQTVCLDEDRHHDDSARPQPPSAAHY